MFIPEPSIKDFVHDRYVALFLQYFDFNRKDVRALTLFLFSPFETVKLATRPSSNTGSNVNIVTFSNVGPNSS